VSNFLSLCLKECDIKANESIYLDKILYRSWASSRQILYTLSLGYDGLKSMCIKIHIHVNLYQKRFWLFIFSL